MMFLKQSTASQTVILGPFVDSTDGNTQETGLTIANTDIKLSKNGGTIASKNSGGATHDANGWYAATLDATDTNTVGRLQLYVHVSGALPVVMQFQVLEEAIYDALIGSSATGLLPANVTQFDGVAGTFASGRPEVNTSHWGGTAVASATVNANATQISGDSVAADNLEAALDGTGGVTITAALTGNVTGNLSGSVGSVTGAVGSVTGNVGGNVAGSVASVTAGVTVTTNNDKTGYALSAAGVDAVWDEALSGHTTAGTAGKALSDAGAAGDPWATSLPGAYGAGTAGKIIGDNLNAPVGTVDTVVDAIKAKTDNLPASPAATGDAMTLTSAYDFAKGTVAMTEGYAADGAAMTPAQALHMIWGMLAEKSVAGTTLTVKKLDGTTSAMTFTLDDSATPTSITRAT